MQYLLNSFDDPAYARQATINAIQELARRSYVVEFNQLQYGLPPGEHVMTRYGSLGELLPPYAMKIAGVRPE